MAENLRIGETVVVPWGAGEVRGTVNEVYGAGDDRKVVVLLTPEVSGYVVDEPTTVVWPHDRVRRDIAVA